MIVSDLIATIGLIVCGLIAWGVLALVAIGATAILTAIF